MRVVIAGATLNSNFVLGCNYDKQKLEVPGLAATMLMQLRDH
jgi:hypothetical protein